MGRCSPYNRCSVREERGGSTTVRAHLGYVELGAIYAPSKDLDLALGIMRNIRDGHATTTQAAIGLTWRFR